MCHLHPSEANITGARISSKMNFMNKGLPMRR